MKSLSLLYFLFMKIILLRALLAFLWRAGRRTLTAKRLGHGIAAKQFANTAPVRGTQLCEVTRPANLAVDESKTGNRGSDSDPIHCLFLRKRSSSKNTKRIRTIRFIQSLRAIEKSLPYPTMILVLLITKNATGSSASIPYNLTAEVSAWSLDGVMGAKWDWGHLSISEGHSNAPLSTLMCR